MKKKRCRFVYIFRKIRRLAGYYKPYRRVFWTDMFFAFVSAAVELVIPLAARYVTSAIGSMQMQEAQGMLLRLGMMLAALVLVQQRLYYNVWARYGSEDDMRAQIFSYPSARFWNMCLTRKENL